ncbi:MAG TPA: hypothetical protein EYN67_18715 [Flavobacteriales bacterium]|nr:hypothetical protein [Flavobacteriales bacterium]
MSVTKFKFVSPGVFINEIDNSQRPRPSDPIGPLIIGRTERGPTMRPVRINSFSDFIEVFGSPIAGQQGDDVWRSGNRVGPTYAAYAAQAWLRNTNACTIVRLAGMQHSDAAASGYAGWATSNSATEHGAWGLFLFPSASATTVPTGTLAAIWYLEEGGCILTGTMAGDASAQTSGSNVMISSNGANSQFKMMIVNGAADDRTVTEETSFNFNRNSALYIRNVFNTNPMLVNSGITDTDAIKKYWLGETFDRAVADVVHSVADGSGEVCAFVAPLKAGSSAGTPSNMAMGAQEAKSGWVFSQDLSDNHTTFQPAAIQKLLRFVTLNTGEWEQQNLKISIQNIKTSTNEYNKYGTFDVVVRSAKDTDNAVRTVERFSGCTLNPFSMSYIGRKIGTQHLVWSDNERRYRTYGDHPSVSRFMRVEVASVVEKGTADPLYLPFGFEGPTRYKDWTLAVSGTAAASGTDISAQTSMINESDASDPYAVLNPLGDAVVDRVFAPNIDGFCAGWTLSAEVNVTYPGIALRGSAADGGLPDPADAYMGLDTGRNGAITIFEDSFEDLVRSKPNGIDSWDGGDSFPDTVISSYFTLDDVVGTGGTQVIGVYTSGSRAAGSSLTAISSSYKEVLSQGYDSFTMPLFGGFDGLDIRESEPFGEHTSLKDGTDTTSYEYYSIKRAIDMCADPEVVQYDLMTMPGLRHEGLTSHMINVCENRGDAMAIIDLGDAYTPRTESTDKAENRGANVDSTVSNLQNRALNSSYGACYYPWVQIRDTMTGQSVWAPPSIIALGAMSYGQKTQELWFAPAGFTRGGLTEGRGGVPVSAVSHRLTSKERDKLYEANINPIAQFPNEGIVIFGQKTLQVTPSALDRINVRRLMIYVKREIAKMASGLLFDQNVTSTWNKFLSKVNPFLGSVKARLGLMDFKVILDTTTTTPDLIDRNIMYAKIYLKPAKAIEFIAIDFVITDSGAAFED